MKIGILTFSYPFNYGAMLQAYALQKHLSKEGFETKIIDYRIHMVEELYRVFWKPHMYINGLKKSPLHPFFRIYNSLKESPYTIQRKRAFLNFEKKRDKTKTIYDLKEIEINDFDVIICGSDQIWDPKHTDGFKDCYLGKIDGFNGKIISYAPSMGAYEPSEEDLEYLRQVLTGFSAISVRDESTKNKCKDIIDKDIEIVLDPTFLLEKKEWEEILPSEPIEEDYILVYNLNNDKLVDEKAKELSHEYGIKVIELCVTDFNKKTPWEKIYSAGPIEFLNYIKNASFVVTSSFHATVFSLIFERRVFGADNLRIRNLLSEVGCSHLILNGESKDKEPLNAVAKNISEKINEMALKSKEFLKKNI